MSERLIVTLEPLPDARREDHSIPADVRLRQALKILQRVLRVRVVSVTSTNGENDG